MQVCRAFFRQVVEAEYRGDVAIELRRSRGKTEELAKAIEKLASSGDDTDAFTELVELAKTVPHFGEPLAEELTKLGNERLIEVAKVGLYCTHFCTRVETARARAPNFDVDVPQLSRLFSEIVYRDWGYRD